MNDFNHIDIHELLPQQEPFVFIDRLCDFSMERTQTAFTVKDGALFVKDGRLSTTAIIENIAQTCAARLGYINKYILHKPVLIGFIGAVKDLQLRRSPLVGETLLTEVNVLQDLMNITLAEAKVLVGEEIIAQGTLKIAVNDTTESLQNP